MTLIQGNRCIEAKIKHFRIFMRKPSILRFFYARNRLRALSKLENASLTLIQGLWLEHLDLLYSMFFWIKLSTLNPYFYWGQIDPCLNRLEILRFYLKNLAFLQFHINSPIDNESSLIEEPRSKRSSQTIRGIPRNSSLKIRGVKLTPVWRMRVNFKKCLLFTQTMCTRERVK